MRDLRINRQTFEGGKTYYIFAFNFFRTILKRALYD